MNITKNLFWVAVDRAGFTGLQFIANVILARILAPEDFGIYSMTVLFVSLSNMLVDSGMTGYLIKKNDPSNEDYSTLFTTNFFVSIAIYLLLFGFAPIIEEYYLQEGFAKILRVVSLSIIIRSFGIVQFCILHRTFKFKQEAFLNTVSYSISVVIAILMALKGFGVWALIIQQVSFALIQTFTVMTYIRFIARIGINFTSLKEMFGFGIKLLGSSVINVMYNDILGLIIAKYFNVRSAGIFFQAKKISNIPASVFSIILDRASFPMLSRVETDNQFQKMASTVSRTIHFVAFPILANIVLFADIIIYLILGDQWYESVRILQLLGLGVVFLVIESGNRNIMKSKGLVGLILKAEIVKKTVGFILIFLALSQGLIWVAGSLLVGFFLNAIVNLCLVHSKTNYQFLHQVKDICIPLAAVLVSITPSIFYIYYLDDVSLLAYAVLTTTQLIIYLGIGLIMKIKEFEILKNRIFNGF